ncbi:MAG: hypothetical protein FWE61_01755 [Micrococcales bacterium]|nr:hypothetical protein [Micrococcales bacterium]
MLLPTKGISADRALLSVGATVLSLLESPTTVSGLWERYTRQLEGDDGVITFDWFALSLTMLFVIDAVSWDDLGRLERHHVSA